MLFGLSLPILPASSLPQLLSWSLNLHSINPTYPTAPSLQLQRDNWKGNQCPGSQRRTKEKEAAEKLRVSCPEYMRIIKHFPPHFIWRILPSLGVGVGECWWETADVNSSMTTQNWDLDIIHKGLNFLIILTWLWKLIPFFLSQSI